jgi:hypothetical protein
VHGGPFEYLFSHNSEEKYEFLHRKLDSQTLSFRRAFPRFISLFLEEFEKRRWVFSGAALDDECRIRAEKGLIMKIYHFLSLPFFCFFPLIIG